MCELRWGARVAKDRRTNMHAVGVGIIEHIRQAYSVSSFDTRESLSVCGVSIGQARRECIIQSLKAQTRILPEIKDGPYDAKGTQLTGEILQYFSVCSHQGTR